MTAAVALTSVVWLSGYGPGAAAAARDQIKGENHLYFLCCGYFPRGAVEERRDEILKREHNFSFACIGGILPRPRDANFAEAYNFVAGNMLIRRVGRDFLVLAENRARKDVAAASAAR